MNPDEQPRKPYEPPKVSETEGDQSARATARADEALEARRQARHLAYLSYVVRAIALVVIVLGGLLYAGIELPPYGMNVQPADSTGYRTPPRTQFMVAGTVPVTGVEPALPVLPGRGIPAQAAALRNPLPATPAVLQRGAVAYMNNCSFCHGATAQGEGPVSESYVPRATDLTLSRVQALPEGSIYYDITAGILSTPIPTARQFLPRRWHSFEGTITAADRWAITAFVKSLNVGQPAHITPTPAQITNPTGAAIMPGTTSVIGAPSTDPALRTAGLSGTTASAAAARAAGATGTPGISGTAGTPALR